jgi:hypothetical protein
MVENVELIESDPAIRADYWYGQKINPKSGKITPKFSFDSPEFLSLI